MTFLHSQEYWNVILLKCAIPSANFGGGNEKDPSTVMPEGRVLGGWPFCLIKERTKFFQEPI